MRSQKEIYAPFFDLAVSADCGQAFRWEKRENGDWHGVIRGKVFDLYQSGDMLISRRDIDDGERKMLIDYFSLDTDYEKICLGFSEDENLARAVKAFPGIRILRQEPWEALCSFIISQNNNIPRIKGIISRLCVLLGDDLGGGDFSFPPPERVIEAGVEGLSPIRSGFRAKYIIDAAEKCSSGEIDFERIRSLSVDEGAEELKKIKGVGDKVAMCALLYGFNKFEAFPVDVWVKRIMAEMYPGGLPECTRGFEGVAQQYLFHWRRSL
ncbi:MAG: DNA-3-methyladenine glycosylase 2 [Clostridiales bacterium]|nr:DNA-3-methyladenine glycosylase 2 [Clostridiales bacterium]